MGATLYTAMKWDPVSAPNLNDGNVVNGNAPPWAMHPISADLLQMSLLYRGAPDYVIACDLPATTAISMPFWVRPFCNRLNFAALASGTGTVDFTSTGAADTVSINVSLTGGTLGDAAWLWGPTAAAAVLTVTPSALGVPTLHDVDVSRTANVTVYAILVYAFRAASAL